MLIIKLTSKIENKISFAGNSLSSKKYLLNIKTNENK